ncbi:peptidoglycan-binding protein [Streptomyces sp. TRM 70361]|uniref:peptidoglycan-binding protein n=1 Tax=Streptomyces sp. TRM 70361 TaxID=3116553 RepID=UPI002E7B897F|nr:peptidoglycan-binding protein [Streptomyces sp. TRM 70361]MEE1938967.1 peptidoglycan-binding protein [Streptomyces sp. TRM 70361]
MSRWKELPVELDAPVRRLVVRLRGLKDHSGLSMRQLAAKTGYSAKSWERYLGGRSLPPRDAVEAMARICGEDPTRLLALHEVAAEAWGAGRGGASAPEAAGTAGAESPPAESGRGRPHGRPPRIALVAGAVVLALAVSTAVLLFARSAGGDGRAGAEPSASSAAAAPGPASGPAAEYTCRVERVDGRWYAGNSRTREAIVAYGHAGPEVAEVQCLLRRAGIEPGDVDGIYGPLTQRAVERAQKRAGLVVDGIVGPHTWQALREWSGE